MTTLQQNWPLKKPQQLVYVELGPHNGGMMLGICEEGFSFRAVGPVMGNGPITFAFALDGKNRLKGIGELAWTEEDGKTGGLKFTEISPQVRESLRAWLAGDETPKIVGREVTPAAATPLDSMEKIKARIRTGYTEEVKTPPPAPVPVPVVEPKREAIIETKAPERFVAPVVEPKPVEKTEVAAPVAKIEPKPEVVAQPVHELPRMQLPSVLEKEEPVAETAPPVTQQEIEPPAIVGNAEAAVAAEPERPWIPPAEEPIEAEVAQGESSAASPRLNRAAAAGIISLALAVILGALVLSFRREVGETLIRLGESLAGEERKPAPNASQASPAAVSTPEPVKPNDAVPANTVDANSVATGTDKPAVTEPEKPKPEAPVPAKQESVATAPATNSRVNAQPKQTESNNTSAVQSAAEKPQDKLPGPAPGETGTGQKEFEQARNILRGDHRQRDLPQAVELLWTGVRKGYVPAEVTLADLFARGDGVEKSCDQARVLLQSAVRKGSPEGRRRLGQLKDLGCP